MAKQTIYTLSCRITDQQGQPIEDLLVHVFDQDPNTPDNPLGQPAITDAEGKYSISFSEVDFKIGGVESGGLDLFIRVYADEELLGESHVERNASLNKAISAEEGNMKNYYYTSAKNKNGLRFLIVNKTMKLQPELV